VFRFANTLDIDSLWSIWRKLFPHVDLLTDYTFLYTHLSEMRRIRRQRRICRITGHLWELENYDPTSNTFVLKCARCFPHIDSRQTIVSYDPFTTVERKTD